MLGEGFSLDQRDRLGRTFLTAAAYLNRKETVRFLLGKGVNAEEREKSGDDALIAAKRTGDPEMVEILLDHGVDKEAKNKGETALDIAFEKDDFVVMESLIRRGASLDTLDMSNILQR